ncbi:MAG: hypothetical protein M3Y07_11850 [Acidobacteriota bacterium]|nr:hypothetical protein [Acidobacteriota bacterium]
MPGKPESVAVAKRLGLAAVQVALRQPWWQNAAARRSHVGNSICDGYDVPDEIRSLGRD